MPDSKNRSLRAFPNWQAPATHHLICHVQIRLGDDRALHFDPRACLFTHQRSDHEKCRGELAAHVSANSNAIACPAPVAVDDNRRTAICFFRASSDTDLTQSVKQRLNGPLTHSLDTVKSESSCTCCHKRGQESNRRPRVSQNQICWPRREWRGFDGSNVNCRYFSIPLRLDCITKLLKRGCHDFRVFAPQHSIQTAGSGNTIQRR